MSSRYVDVVCAYATDVMNNERAALFHIPNRNLGGIRERPCRAKEPNASCSTWGADRNKTADAWRN